MARFTKAIRERIVRDFTARHNGRFDPAVFVEEVGAAGPSHAAYDWFEWDDADAAMAHRVEQARSFVQGIQVTFSVESIARGKVTVRESVMPLALSPMAGRRDGGGYFINDPTNPEHMAEFCGQAARDLDAWLKRYRAAVLFSGGSVAHIERVVAAVSRAAEQREVANAA